MKKVVGGVLIAIVLSALIAGLFFGYTQLAILIILLVRVGLFIAPVFNKE